MKLVELNNGKTDLIKRNLEALGATDVKIYNMDTGSIVIYNKEKGREHVSISNEKRLPTWDEIKYIRYNLMKQDSTVAQILPPKKDYVNIHENCFHLWELHDKKFEVTL